MIKRLGIEKEKKTFIKSSCHCTDAINNQLNWAISFQPKVNANHMS